MTEDLWKSEKFIFVSKMANLWNKVNGTQPSAVRE
jgi:hypothetical protein